MDASLQIYGADIVLNSWLLLKVKPLASGKSVNNNTLFITAEGKSAALNLTQLPVVKFAFSW